MNFSDEQRAIVESPEQVIFVSAAAGSGKTTVIAARVAWLIERGMIPETICVVVFTRTAAAMLRAKIAQIVGERAAGVTISTFHALISSWILKPGERVATEAEADAAFESIYAGDRRLPARIATPKEALRDAIARREAGLEVDKSIILNNNIGTILCRMRETGTIPLWDLVPRANYMAFSDVLPIFRHVMVDEAMDVSPAQIDLAWHLLSPDGAGTMMAVADPRQQIFEWRHGVGFGGLGAGGRWRLSEPTHRMSRSFRFGHAIAGWANSTAALFGGEPIYGTEACDTESPGEAHIHPWEVAIDMIAEAPGCTLILARKHRAWGEKETGWTCDRLMRALEDRRIPAEHVRPEPRDPLSSESDRFERAWARGRAVVSTVHGAKGTEADTVVLAQWSQDDSPEELRVQYVGITRARRRLVLLGRTT